MSHANVTVGSLNLPGNKPQLAIGPSRRGHVAARILADQGVAACSLLEVFDDVRAAFTTRHPNWHMTSTPANNITPRRGAVGNEIIADARRAEIVGTGVFPLVWRKRRLSLTVAHLRTPTGAEWTQLAVHLPTRRDAGPLVRRRMLRLVARYAKSLADDGRNVVLCGDWNRPDVIGAFGKGWKVAARHGVDQIIVGPGIKVHGGEAVVTGVKGAISDHPLVLAHLRIPERTTR